MGKALSGELSCPCDRSCFSFLLMLNSKFSITHNEIMVRYDRVIYNHSVIFDYYVGMCGAYSYMKIGANSYMKIERKIFLWMGMYRLL